jgi:hypothetical protein
VYIAGTWVGLCYSAKVRRADFDMSADFEQSGAGTSMLTIATEWKFPRPVYVERPTVEAYPLVNKAGQRSVAFMNWAYRRTQPKGEALVPETNLKVRLSELGEIKSVRSARHGDLKLEARDGETTVTLPRLDEIDLLILN